MGQEDLLTTYQGLKTWLESYENMKRFNVALDPTRAEIVGAAVSQLVVKEAPRKVGQIHLGSAKTRVTEENRIGMMHTMGIGGMTMVIENKAIAIMIAVVIVDQAT